MGTTIGMVSRLEIGDAPVAFTVWDTKLNSYPEVVSFTHINRTKGTEMIELKSGAVFRYQLGDNWITAEFTITGCKSDKVDEDGHEVITLTARSVERLPEENLERLKCLV